MALLSGPPAAKALRLVGPALIITLAVGCDSAQRATTPRPTTVRPATRLATRPSAGPPAQGATWRLVPRARREKFLAALKAIDRPLAADDKAALTHAVEICFKVYDNASHEALRALTRETYSSDIVTISPADAGKIIAAAKTWICPAGEVHRRWQS